MEGLGCLLDGLGCLVDLVGLPWGLILIVVLWAALPAGIGLVVWGYTAPGIALIVIGAAWVAYIIIRLVRERRQPGGSSERTWLP